jgi:putative ubiquitin-RnfH superfamily antitoxin RatB of RatAB toxin-antitoxin module
MVGEWWGRGDIIRLMDAQSRVRIFLNFFTTLIAALGAVFALLSASSVPPTTGTILVFVTAAFGAAVFTAALTARRQADEQQREVQIQTLQKKADEEPERAKPAWDLARATLEKYFQRNLNQVRMIFYAAVFVMLVGFGFVLWGVRAAITKPDQVKIAIIASASGVITQFIGLTFMALYRSTMLQATQYMSILERINTVGMAVQILDQMTDKTAELKDTTRVDIIRLLLASPTTRMSFTPRKSNRPSAKKEDK